MFQIDVELHYLCSHCNDAVVATLICSGTGNHPGPHGAAMANLECPHCGKHSRVIFELSGLILDVFEPKPCESLQPSVN